MPAKAGIINDKAFVLLRVFVVEKFAFSLGNKLFRREILENITFLLFFARFLKIDGNI